MNQYPLNWPAGRPRTRISLKLPGEGKPATLLDATRRVERELALFNRRGREPLIFPDWIVVSTNIPVREDGLPFSNTGKPYDSGAAVHFKIGSVPYCMACDAYMEVTDNLAAIAKTIEALRSLIRIGVYDMRAAFVGCRITDNPVSPTEAKQEESANEL